MNLRAVVALALVIGAGTLIYSRVGRKEVSLDQIGSDNTPAKYDSPAASRATGSRKNDARPSDAASEELAPDAIAAARSQATQKATAAPPPVAETAESSSLAPETVVENMRTTIRKYGAMFGENPVGTNPEITSALHGDNPKHIDFLRQDGNRVNATGELVDSWGTPYFFHQISGHEMEIRSAGPDRIMYTADDLVTR